MNAIVPAQYTNWKEYVGQDVLCWSNDWNTLGQLTVPYFAQLIGPSSREKWQVAEQQSEGFWLTPVMEYWEPVNEQDRESLEQYIDDVYYGQDLWERKWDSFLKWKQWNDRGIK